MIQFVSVLLLHRHHTEWRGQHVADTCVSVIGQYGVKFEVLTGTTDGDVTPCHLVGRYGRLEAAMEFPTIQNVPKNSPCEPAVVSYNRRTHRVHVEVHKRHFSDASLQTHPNEQHDG